MRHVKAGRLAAAALIIALAAGQAQAAPPPSQDGALRLQLAREYFVANGGAEAVKARLRQVFTGIQAPLAQSMPSSIAPAVQSTMVKMVEELEKQTPELVDITAQAYADRLSADELRALLAWSHSPAGISIREKMPQIQADIIARQGPLVTTLMTNMVEKVVSDTCAQTSCTPEQRQQLHAVLSRAVPPG